MMLKKANSILLLKISYILKSFSIAILILILIIAPIKPGNKMISSLILATSQTSTKNLTRLELENQLQQLEKEIENYEQKIKQFRHQKRTLKNQIEQLEIQEKQLNLKIQAINLNLASINKEIEDIQSKISDLEAIIQLNHQALSTALQILHENDHRGLVEILLTNSNISDFFSSINNILAIQQSLKINLKKINQSKQELIFQQQELAKESGDIRELKKYREYQKTKLINKQLEKNRLLKVTQGKEKVYQKILTQTKKTAAEIRSQIFKLLGGEELDFETAYKLASMAEKATGVRAALILAVLDQESALGKNVGKCNYKTAMHPKRDIPHFLKIVRELNLNPNIVKVSCPNQDGYYGGAMGPAQFLPSTWIHYKDRIAKITKRYPPSPWNNADAFLATALYLKDAGADKGGIRNERIAAAKYYAGSRWQRHLWGYGDRVIERARSIQRDIDIITSQTSQ